METFIIYFIAAVVMFAILVYVLATVRPERFPKSTVITMPILAVFGILTLVLWIGNVSPPAI